MCEATKAVSNKKVVRWVWVWKIFAAKHLENELLFPKYMWHGRGRDGYKRGVWHKAQPPIDDSTGGMFHACPTQTAARVRNKHYPFAFRGQIVRVQFRQIIGKDASVITAKEMRIPKLK